MIQLASLSQAKWTMRALVLLLLSAGGNLAYTQQPAESQPAETQPAAELGHPHDGTYLIGADDVLSVSVWKEPDLTRSIPVRSDGKISMPLIGEVEASGRTPLQLEKEISEKLRSFITVPEVTVIVEKINSKKFNILGEVGKPGSYPISVPTTIVDAIALAGGFRDFAKTKDIYVLRNEAGGAQKKIGFNYKDFVKGKNPAGNIALVPGDTIVVP